MVAVGVVLVVIAVLVVAAVLVDGGESAQLQLGGLKLDTNLIGVFTAGALTVLLAVIGLSLLINGLKRTRRKRAEVNALKARATTKEPSAVRATPSRSERNEPDAAGSSTAGQRRLDEGEDDGTDEYFKSAPRDH